MNIHRIYIDTFYIEGKSILHEMDPRVKTILALLLIFSIVSMREIYIPLAVFVSSLIILLILGSDLRKLLISLSLTASIVLIILFTYGGKESIWSFGFLSLTKESLKFSLLIFFRALACISILIIYLSTTRTNEIVQSLAWFKIPEVMITLSLMMLRYIGTLSKEAERMFFSAKSRHAFSNFLPYHKRVYNLGTLAGALFLRSIDRAERVYLGMLSKGYSIKLEQKPFKATYVFQTIVIVLIVLLMVYADRMIP